MRTYKLKMALVAYAAAAALIMSGCDSDSESTSGQAEQTFRADKVMEIAIQTDGQNIEIVPSSGSDIRINSKSGKEVPAELNGDVLSIHFESSAGIHFKTDRLHIEIPSKTYRKISLASESGHIEGQQLDANELVLSGGSGKIEVSGYTGSRIEGHSAAGNIELTDVEGELNIDNDTGDVNIGYVGQITNKSSITTGTGDVQLKFDHKPDALSIDASSESGKIKTSLVDESKVSDDGAGKLLRTTIGSESSETPSLKIRTSTGNISLE
ncbi:putative adhesin [Paenibacillus cellulosilyticus]|uniref:Putative adhesin n=1 Tax=Paenibacillus cellulosilyticus TaxID=375489 RepID=A0A2V2YD61_9BACL|nr:DUF4097 family beta strand repeat-containing protein [Paenibacillus cellulosilyticus]PWV89407.1 putative adhesin [Paenibacillus cellulosilyticus]QKS47302.1 DUF4097 family beta strand repeat protein [Paenibacillus cellulosilyticus]